MPCLDSYIYAFWMRLCSLQSAGLCLDHACRVNVGHMHDGDKGIGARCRSTGAVPDVSRTVAVHMVLVLWPIFWPVAPKYYTDTKCWKGVAFLRFGPIRRLVVPQC
jgi:hypothetical protein